MRLDELLAELRQVCATQSIGALEQCSLFTRLVGLLCLTKALNA